MHDLAILIKQARNSTECMAHLEKAVDMLIHDIDNYTTLEYLLHNGDECQLYCTIIIERRLKILVRNPNAEHSICLLTKFMNGMFSKCVNHSVINKISDSYALSILYFYPKYNSDFFDIILNTVQNQNTIGYLVLRQYLFMLEVSTEITAERRVELKKAGKECIEQTLDLLLIKHGGNNIFGLDMYLLTVIIEIFTNALIFYKQYERLLDFVCLAKLQNNVTVEFFARFLTFDTRNPSNIDKILNYAINSDISYAYEIINQLYTSRIDLKSKTLYDNILRLLNSGYFILSINFLVKIYKKEKMNEDYTIVFLKKVVTESFKLYNSMEYQNCWLDYNPDEMTESLLKNKIEDFVRLASQKTSMSVSILQMEIIPNKLGAIILNIYPNATVYSTFLQNYQLYHKNISPDIENLDISEIETCRLALSSVKKFDYPSDQMFRMIEKARNVEHTVAEDLIVAIAIKLTETTGNDFLPTLINDFDENSLAKLVIFIKKGYKSILDVIPKFIAKFEESKEIKFLPLIGICIKNKIPCGNSLQIIYENIKIWPYKELHSVINNIINYTDEEATQAYIRLILDRIMNEEELGILARCFLNMIERKITTCVNNIALGSIDKSIDFYSILLIELLNKHETYLVKRVAYLISSANLEINYPLAVYKLMILYHADDIPDAQPDILNFLADILPKMQDLSVFMQVNKSMQEIQSLKDSLSPNKKNNVLILKDFLKNIKGANFKREGILVGSQIPKSVEHESGVDISKYYKDNQ